MTAIPGPSADNRISSHPVRGFKFVEGDREVPFTQTMKSRKSTGFMHRLAELFTRGESGRVAGRGVEIASVVGSLMVGLLLVSGAAAIFGKVLLVGIQFLVG